MFCPYELSRSDRYCRLLPPNDVASDPSALKALGLSMRSNRTRIPFARMSPPPPAGYTYTGQFILHDLIRDDSSLTDAQHRSATATVNGRQPRLNLSSLYGDGPFSEDRHLYESDNASLKLGAVRTKRGLAFDLPLDPKTSRPQLADARNSENLVVRQIHAMWLRFHNRVVEALRGEVAESGLFEKARQIVRWQFQWLIRFDYLPKVCQPAAYRDVVLKGNRAIAWPTDGFSIPVELSHAAARFGHSMVRPNYDLNQENVDVPLRQIIGEALKPGPLDPSFAIDWRHFFSRRAPSNNIDTAICEAMFELPAEALRRFGAAISPDNPTELPVRTLRRGAAVKLPSGEQMRDALSPESVIAVRLAEFPRYQPWSVLVDLGLEKQTPLWYYILLEAEVSERGAHLGAVGSRLLAEVIEAVLQAEPTSIVWELKKNPRWHPRPYKLPSGEMIEIDSFLDLTLATGLVDASGPATN